MKLDKIIAKLKNLPTVRLNPVGPWDVVNKKDILELIRELEDARSFGDLNSAKSGMKL